MAMTKAEKARVENLELGIKLAKAMRWPDYNLPAPMTLAEIKANLVEGGKKYSHTTQGQMVARGWFARRYDGGRVSYGCSDGHNHNSEGDVTTTQAMGRMFANEVDAWRYLRLKLTEEYAVSLSRIDGHIARCLDLRTEPAPPSQESDRG